LTKILPNPPNFDGGFCKKIHFQVFKFIVIGAFLYRLAGKEAEIAHLILH